MNKFYERATGGAIPSVKFKFLNCQKIKIYTDENETSIVELYLLFPVPYDYGRKNHGTRN